MPEHDESELPDPAELFERMRGFAESKESSLPENDDELPDPEELFREMEEYRRFHSATQAEDGEPEVLPDALELFEQMTMADGTVDLLGGRQQEVLDALNLPLMDSFPEDGFANFPSGEVEALDLPSTAEPGGDRDSLLPIDDIRLPLPQTPLVASEERSPERLSKSEQSGHQNDDPRLRHAHSLPTPEELFRRMKAEREEAELNFEHSSERGLTLPTIRGESHSTIPSPEELFQRLAEERQERVDAGEELPPLPDLDAFKLELEEEERARLDPDLLGDLAGPERFVETVSDSMFTAVPLSSFPAPPQEVADFGEDWTFDSFVDPDDVPSVLSAAGTIKVEPERLLDEPLKRETYRPSRSSPSEQASYEPAMRPMAPVPRLARAEPVCQDKTDDKMPKFKRFSRHKLAIYTRQMAVMLKSGIQLHLAIQFAAESDPEMRPLLNEIMAKVETGYTYSAAISDASRSFDPIYVGLVQAGELSGRMPDMLERLADVLEREVEIRKRIVSVVTYPIVLLLVCLVGTLGFVFFVLPALTPLFDDLGVDLPLPTRILLASRDFILPTIVTLGLLLAGYHVFRDKITDFIRSKQDLDRRLAMIPFKIPLFGDVYEKLVTARVLYSLSTMLDVGITVNQALARAETTAGNAFTAHQLRKARIDLTDGIGVTECFRINGLFNEAALNLISAGEEAAQLAEMFKFVARLLDEEVEYSLQSASSVLEPIIMIVMGLIVGFITISAALPTIQLLQNFS